MLSLVYYYLSAIKMEKMPLFRLSMLLAYSAKKLGFYWEIWVPLKHCQWIFENVFCKSLIDKRITVFYI